jgi:hypothetical protein
MKQKIQALRALRRSVAHESEALDVFVMRLRIIMRRWDARGIDFDEADRLYKHARRNGWVPLPDVCNDQECRLCETTIPCERMP